MEIVFNPFTYEAYGSKKTSDPIFVQNGQMWNCTPARSTDADAFPYGYMNETATVSLTVPGLTDDHGWLNTQYRSFYTEYTLPPNNNMGVNAWWTITNESSGPVWNKLASLNYEPNNYIAKVRHENGSDYIFEEIAEGWNVVFDEMGGSEEPIVLNANNLDPNDLTHSMYDCTVGKFYGLFYLATNSTGAMDDIEETAYRYGYDAGEEYGYREGHRDGVIEGEANNEATLNAFDMFGQAFTATGEFLGIEVLPNLTIGTIIIVPTIVTLLVVIIRILKK